MSSPPRPRAPVPRRTCVASRREAGQDELLRLVRGPEGRALVDYRGKLGGRGAWVTPRRAEIELLERKPRILSRALRAPVDTGGLLDRARSANLSAVAYALSIAARSGALAGGKQRVRAALADGALALVLASDASERLKRDLRTRAGDTPVLEIPLDRATLGARVGKGPRAALVIKRGKTGALLAMELRRMVDLS